MIPKLFTSVLVASFGVVLVHALAPATAQQDLISILSMAAIVISGYHRRLLPLRDSAGLFEVPVPDAERMRESYMLWGFPLGKPRSVRIATSTRRGAAHAPNMARSIEVLPEVLRWPTRKLLHHRHS